MTQVGPDGPTARDHRSPTCETPATARGAAASAPAWAGGGRTIVPAQMGTRRPATVTARATATAGRSMATVHAAPITERPASSPSTLIQAGSVPSTREIGGSDVAPMTVAANKTVDAAAATMPTAPAPRDRDGRAHGLARLPMRGIVQPCPWPHTRVVRNGIRANPLVAMDAGA